MNITDALLPLAQPLALVYIAAAVYAAYKVFQDARSRDDLVLGLHPAWWVVVTLASGVVGVVAYWLLHYSSFRDSQKTDAVTDSPDDSPSS